jgi:threonylcarbamoyladenosine tRNA methylthiotransferase MtaB
MLDLAETSQTNFQRRFIGGIQLVLFEQSTKGICSGVTANYIKVYTKSSHDLTNNVVPIKLIQIGRNGMWGELAE